LKTQANKQNTWYQEKKTAERYVYVSRVCSRSFLMASTFVSQLGAEAAAGERPEPRTRCFLG